MARGGDRRASSGHEWPVAAQPGSPRALRRAITAMSTSATPARANSTIGRPHRHARHEEADPAAVQTTSPKTASPSRSVSADRAGGAPAKPAVGSW